jgi:isoprenylcysteine carboxyl methyltransferase (ICMT) family protein YpbQ
VLLEQQNVHQLLIKHAMFVVQVITEVELQHAQFVLFLQIQLVLLMEPLVQLQHLQTDVQLLLIPYVQLVQR